LFAARGMALLGPLDVAPALAFREDDAVGAASDADWRDIAAARRAALEIGRRDVGQGAVAIGGEAVAVETEGGTDALLRRTAALRRERRLTAPGGALVKCMKPQQDARLDVPTIGPETARLAAEAGLNGVAAEAGRALIAGREATRQAFASAGLFLHPLSADESSRDA
jgi:DUF1009 family protein